MLDSWVRNSLPYGSKEWLREVRVLAGKESWLTRRWRLCLKAHEPDAHVRAYIWYLRRVAHDKTSY